MKMVVRLSDMVLALYTLLINIKMQFSVIKVADKSSCDFRVPNTSMETLKSYSISLLQLFCLSVFRTDIGILIQLLRQRSFTTIF